MVIQSRNVPALVAVLALTLALIFDGIHLLQDQEFNEALGTGTAAKVNGRGDARRQFAKAYELQQQGDFKAAVKAYARIASDMNSLLPLDVKFNLANLYFREAIRMREVGDNDLAMPLLELAKQNYRDVLRIDSGHWDVKYNLELALVLAPEMDPVDPMDEVNPERSPRAITKMQSREPLP